MTEINTFLDHSRVPVDRACVSSPGRRGDGGSLRYPGVRCQGKSPGDGGVAAERNQHQ